jgi:integrase
MIPHVPKYCRHQATGQAFVNLPLGQGKYQRVYLGVHGRPKSHAKYERVIAQWLGSRRTQKLPGPEEITVGLLVAEYFGRAATKKYQAMDPDSGALVPTEMIHRVKSALRPIVNLFGEEPAAEFGPRAFEAVREHYVEQGYTRPYVNALTNCVRSFLAWAVKQELIPSEKAYAIKLIKNYRLGETTAPDNDDVEPVPEEYIAPVQAIVLPPVRDLIHFQLLTGCRPGEGCRLRASEIDRSGPIWFYRPRLHKTAKKGKERIIWIGPRAQEVIRPYLASRTPEEYLFSPREAELARLEKLGQTGETRAKERYQVGSYSRAIRRACARLQIPSWHPHQLRHNAATRLEDEFGTQVAQTILGHATLTMTRHYASKRSSKKMEDAAEAIRKVG